MRIVILTAIPFWHPGTTELTLRLREQNIHVTALDIFHGYAINENNEKTDLVPFKLQGKLRRLYMKVFRQSFAKKHTKQADILDLHFVEAYYAKHVPQLGKKYICTIFGSDIFRTSEEQKAMQRGLFSNSNGILLTEQMVPYFEEHYEAQPEKYIFNQYGSDRIDFINEALETLNKARLKAQFQIPEEKIVVTYGYNGIEQQQHVKMLKAIAQLDSALRSKIFLILPMTYGGSAAYHAEVRSALESIDIPFKIFDKRLSDNEIVDLRLVSDITVNMQVTDALASSIKEAFVAQNLLIVGEWLPYGVYESLGARYLKSNLDSLTEALSEGIENLDKWKEAIKINSEIIVNFASWNVLIHRWIEQYNKLSNES